MKVMMMPAQYGDCFCIRTNAKSNVLVDEGLKTTYNEWIKPLILKTGKRNIIFISGGPIMVSGDVIGFAVRQLSDNKIAGMSLKRLREL